MSPRFRRDTRDLAEMTEIPGGGGYSHTLPIQVCAAQRGRDFEAPDLERGTISEAFSRTGYKKLWITALSSA